MLSTSPTAPGPRGRAAAVLAGLAVFVAGCTGERGRVAVTGAVKLDGVPVNGGFIHLVPEDGALTRAGAPIDGGAFAIPADKGPNRGRYRVYLSWPKPTGKKVRNPDPVEAAKGMPWVEEKKELMPKQFAADTVLTAEFNQSRNTLDLDLKSAEPAGGSRP